MYCSSCASPITPGLSFCNRCGARLEEKIQPAQTSTITAFLTAITLIGICGLAIMFAGSLVLKTGAGMPTDFIAFFMLFTFLITALIEFLLIRNLTRLTASSHSHQPVNYVKPPAVAQQPPLELRPPTAQSFGEPIGSVTDSTTRTLEYARRQQ